MGKRVEYELTHSNTIIAVKFHSIARKGWWKAEVQPTLDTIKAFVPSTQRYYDSSTFLWEFAAEYWEPIKAILTANGFTVLLSSNLAAKAASNPDGSTSKVDSTYVPPDYADSFYTNTTPPTSATQENAAAIASSLSTFLGVDVSAKDIITLKQLYRRKALELHPDRPNGDASKMSELNRLWTIYSSGAIN